jgi:flagellum-specific ATP synthase
MLEVIPYDQSLTQLQEIFSAAQAHAQKTPGQ